MGKYIYGVIGSGAAEEFPLEGVVQFVAGKGGMADPAPGGADGERAYTVGWRDISAVVTDSLVVDYTAMPKDALARLLVRHQQVIERVMARHTILPLRLGTCAENDEQVQQILASGYETIKAVLEEAQGVMEIDVTATISDFHSFLRHVAQAPDVEQVKQSLLQGREEVTTEDRMRVGILVKRHMDREKQQMAAQIHAAFNCLTEDFKAHDLIDDIMVLNSAFLIRGDRQEDFYDQVEELNIRFCNQLDFRCVGPLPPYSFYTLDVRVTHFEEVDWARRQLGLSDDFITVDAIKQAHRKLALTCHPDKNPDVPDIEKKFSDMSRAYKILLDYCRASGGARQEEGVSLNGQDFEKDAILVTTLT